MAALPLWHQETLHCVLLTADEWHLLFLMIDAICILLQILLDYDHVLD